MKIVGWLRYEDGRLVKGMKIVGIDGMIMKDKGCNQKFLIFNLFKPSL